MRKLLVILVMLLVVLSGCSVDTSVDTGLREEVLTARDNLLKYPDYIISNTYEQASGVTTNLVVKHDNIQYIEYPITEAGEIESRDFEDGGKYGLSEYRFADGTWYQFTDMALQKLPKDYGVYRDDARVMYIDILLDNAVSIISGGEVEMPTSYGNETFNCINLEVDSSVMKLLFGMPSYGMFKSANTSTTSKDIKKYTDWVVEDMNLLHTYTPTSRAVVMIDSQNRLRGVSAEARGGGTVSYLTSMVVALDNPNVRQDPDVSNATSFMANLMSVSAAVVDAKSYDEALGIITQLNEEAQSNSGGD